MKKTLHEVKKPTEQEREVFRAVRAEHEELHRQLDCVLMFGSVFTERQGWKDGIDPGGTAEAVIKAMYSILPEYARRPHE